MTSGRDYYYSNGGEAIEQEKSSSVAAIRHVIGVIIVFVIAGMIAMAVLKFRYPDVFFKLAVAVDVFNVKGDSRAERARIDKIALLPISNEKQELLINKTIFMGASPRMVQLALGEPRGTSEGLNIQNKQELRWQFHFAGESEPVVMVFIDHKLSGAQRIDKYDTY